MAYIDRGATYRIVNEAGVEVEVTGQILIERALANEPDTIEGIPLREYVRNQVDAEDTVARAHEQGVDLGPLPNPEEEAQRVADIHELEAQKAVADASANPDDDNHPNPTGDVLDNRDSDRDGVTDQVEEASPPKRRRSAAQE
jgi:hypothetical protein